MNGGNGKCAKLYEDFGNVHTESFKEWWSEGGRSVHLFAEPPTPSIRLLESGATTESDGNKLHLEIPMNLPINHLCTVFRKMVSEQQRKQGRGKRGVRANQETQARYKVAGKVDLNFLENALRLWDYRQAHPELTLWQVAQFSGVAPSKDWIRDKPEKKDLDRAAKMNRLNASASRMLKKAGNIIRYVGRGKFPVSTTKSD